MLQGCMLQGRMVQGPAVQGRVVHGWGEFRLVELPEGTRLVWEEGVDVPGGPLAPLIWRVITPAVRVSFALALRRLARQIERS